MAEKSLNSGSKTLAFPPGKEQHKVEEAIGMDGLEASGMDSSAPVVFWETECLKRWIVTLVSILQIRRLRPRPLFSALVSSHSQGAGLQSTEEEGGRMQWAKSRLPVGSVKNGSRRAGTILQAEKPITNMQDL